MEIAFIQILGKTLEASSSRSIAMATIPKILHTRVEYCLLQYYSMDAFDEVYCGLAHGRYDVTDMKQDSENGGTTKKKREMKRAIFGLWNRK